MSCVGQWVTTAQAHSTGMYGSVDALDLGRNAMAIWQELVDAHAFTARYASVRRFVV